MIRALCIALCLSAAPALADMEELGKAQDVGRLMGLAETCGVAINEPAILDWVRSVPDSYTSVVSDIEMFRDSARRDHEERSEFERTMTCETLAKTARHHGFTAP